MEEITLEWFFEIPGILITGGVVLMIFAILILIIGNSKSKKNKDIVVNNEPLEISPVKLEENALNTNMDLSSVNQNVEPIVNQMPVVEQPMVTPIVEPIVNQTPVVEQPMVTPIVEPIVNQTPVVEQPMVTPIVEPIVNQTPVVEQPTVVPIVEPTKEALNNNQNSFDKIDLNNVQMIMPVDNMEIEEII